MFPSSFSEVCQSLSFQAAASAAIKHLRDPESQAVKRGAAAPIHMTKMIITETTQQEEIAQIES
jgi:hypothetical protein